MNCNAFEEKISLLMDNELPDEESRHVFAHMSTCGKCRDFLRTSLILRSAVSTAKEVDVPTTLRDRVLSILPASPKLFGMRQSWLASWWNRRLAVPIPVVAIALVIGFLTSILSIVLLSKPLDLPQEKPSQVVYIIDMQPIEVLGSYVQSNHSRQ